MKDGPDIARVAALIGDPARANILSALMDGRALTASELASVAGVTPSTTSLHLRKLEQGGLVRPAKQGRHRYFSLAGPDIARVLEALMGLAQSTGATRLRTGPKDADLRRARICYDHLAGQMGVQMFDSLMSNGLLARGADGCDLDTADRSGEALIITAPGRTFLAGMGLDIDALQRGRRKLCRGCLDWSMRRDHLAGALGSALWDRMQALGWASRQPDGRAISFTSAGLRVFDSAFPPTASSPHAA